MFENLSERLSKSLKILQGKHKLSEKNIKEATREVRRALLEADVALEVVEAFISRVEEKAIGHQVEGGLTPTQSFIKLIEKELIRIIGGDNETLNLRTQTPAVIMVAGLQGAGKTTTLAKLAHYLAHRERKKVLLVSADIYRPAAIEQLQILSEQLALDFVQVEQNESPLQIVRRAKKQAQSAFYDVLLIDTAGRLHIDEKMMSEVRALQKEVLPVETLFVVDSMTGQDAARSAKAFGDVLDLTGIVLTKTDGDARGGAALSVRYVTGKPIKFLGVGEKIDALEPFYPNRIVSRLLGMGDVLSLIEEISRKVDKEKAQKTVQKMRKGRFDLNDMREQLLQMQNMGGMANLIDKLPMGQNIPEHIKQKVLDDKKNIYMIAMINAMTKKERQYVNLIKGSRKKRIALGSGVSVQQVNQLLKQFEKMQKMMKKMKGGKFKQMMQKLSGNSDMGKPVKPLF